MANIKFILKDFYNQSQQERDDIVSSLAKEIEEGIDEEIERDMIINAINTAIQHNVDKEFYEVADLLNQVRKKLSK